MIYEVLQNVKPETKGTSDYFAATFDGCLDKDFFFFNYGVVCEIEADSIDDVFRIGNIGPEENIKRIADRMHSISVGDVILVKGDLASSVVVASFGVNKIGEVA